MYRRSTRSWLKHLDFIVLDLICLHLAFILADFIRNDAGLPYLRDPYREMSIVITLIDILIIMVFEICKNILKRGYLKEAETVLLQAFVVLLFSSLYLFSVQQGEEYSRLMMFLTCIFYPIFNYISRVFWKRLVRWAIKNNRNKRSLLIIATMDKAETVVRDIASSMIEEFIISGVVIIDQDMTGHDVERYPVVSSIENAPDYVLMEWVDEVLLVEDAYQIKHKDIIDQIKETGVVVHHNIMPLENSLGGKCFIEKVGGYTVLTTCMNEATALQAFLKRLMDIAGGVVGCIFAGIIYLFIAPAIKRESPGPIIFKQDRVGKNGQIFKMYKFRSMHLDAEARKRDLVAANRVGDGLMFKVDFDPRVIGNTILADGTKKTGIGDFIRRTSLDEFPQFFNILKGEMSLVGTRPPTIDEYTKYKLHHRARMAITPGLTGLWQISGRSNVTEFEQVVALDTKYINEWSLGLDIKILFKTLGVVFKRDGAM